MDMLRYHKFTIGWGWAVEYGSSENEEQFDYILNSAVFFLVRKFYMLRCLLGLYMLI